MEPRDVWVLAPTPPPPPPGLPVTSQHVEPSWLPGTLLAWRMTDPTTRTWTGLVRYSRDGLTYEHWLPGDRIRSDNPTT